MPDVALSLFGPIPYGRLHPATVDPSRPGVVELSRSPGIFCFHDVPPGDYTITTVAYARELMSLNALAADAQEGMGAFVEKRPARWRHR